MRKKGCPKKIFVIVGLVMLFSSSWLVAQESKVKVVVESARIYAEASTDSYRIETIKKGTVLTLFGANQTNENWLYVYYQSPRWESKVTGFIQVEMVEKVPVAQEPESELEEQKKERPAEKSEKKPEKKPGEKLEVKPKTEQKEKQEQKQVYRELEPTALPVQNPLPFPLSFAVGETPRIYEMVEPPQPKIVISEEEPVTEALPEKEKPVVKPKEEVIIPERAEAPKKSLFTFSLGYGPSMGGFGGFLQLNTSGNFSVHWGIGYHPTSMFYPDYDWVEGKALYSVGLKYYLPWRTDQIRPYLDLQYGGISVEAIRVVTGIWYYTYLYEDIQKTLWGPSLLAGLEIRIGSFGLSGAVGASYVVTEWEYWDQPLFFTADIGFLLYF